MTKDIFKRRIISIVINVIPLHIIKLMQEEFPSQYRLYSEVMKMVTYPISDYAISMLYVNALIYLFY